MVGRGHDKNSLLLERRVDDHRGRNNIDSLQRQLRIGLFKRLAKWNGDQLHRQRICVLQLLGALQSLDGIGEVDQECWLMLMSAGRIGTGRRRSVGVVGPGRSAPSAVATIRCDTHLGLDPYRPVDESLSAMA